ncbi:TolC family protein [Paeniroseomonas aquatica]|uniref:TolC family protein n=1 Tax=Paeniroseomonas aquatica TaxID=373043 RepID=A0ABT8A1D7_9PROT|nr:TolC family protein [Paeniroseomonas aquatica]MDN3563544.1 TolC family protein [Paeniroseomonas aquatica]
MVPQQLVRRKPGAAVALGLTLILLAGAGHAQTRTTQRTSGGLLPGATLDSVLAIARQLSPELAARGMDTAAAQARVAIAGSLPDPTIQVMSDDVDRTSGSRPNKMIYSFQQEIPLWGRRDLRRQVARAEVGQMTSQAQAAEAELIERVKTAFARYYTSYEAVHRTEDLHQAIHGVAQVARERYAQGRGEQQEVFRAEVETTRVATEIVRLEAALKSAQGQLNALLVRPIGAPLATPERLRPLPEVRALDAARLADRARAANPALAADAAAINGADTNRRLTDRNWYPDITVGAAAVDRSGFGPGGYQAWVALKVPLQWGLREAQTREAGAQAGAARARFDARELQIRSDLAEAVASFEGNRRTADLIRRRLLPQAQALVRSGAAGYGFGRVDLATVLRAQHDLADFRLQLLSAEFDGQRQLAVIERLVGGDL